MAAPLHPPATHFAAIAAAAPAVLAAFYAPVAPVFPVTQLFADPHDTAKYCGYTCGDGTWFCSADSSRGFLLRHQVSCSWGQRHVIAAFLRTNVAGFVWADPVRNGDDGCNIVLLGGNDAVVRMAIVVRGSRYVVNKRTALDLIIATAAACFWNNPTGRDLSDLEKQARTDLHQGLHDTNWWTRHSRWEYTDMLNDAFATDWSMFFAWLSGLICADACIDVTDGGNYTMRVTLSQNNEGLVAAIYDYCWNTIAPGDAAIRNAISASVAGYTRPSANFPAATLRFNSAAMEWLQHHCMQYTIVKYQQWWAYGSVNAPPANPEHHDHATMMYVRSFHQ
jgi:hypothetical protein